LNAAVSLLFFLVFSAPHRVHHFFEEWPSPTGRQVTHGQSHDHADRNDQRSPDSRPASKPNDCVVLSVAQSAHVSLVASFDLAVFETAAAGCATHLTVTIKSVSASPGSPRAPPRA
jgi:hypothetical protein